MPTYRLRFRGRGFVDACDPNGRQLIDGFCVDLVHSGSSLDAVINSARNGLLANSEVRHLIDETHLITQKEGAWTIECEDAKRLLFSWLFRRERESALVYHWMAPCDIDLPHVACEVGYSNCTENHCAESAPLDDNQPTKK